MCSVSLAFYANAAKQDDDNNGQVKVKKGGNGPAQQSVVAPTTGSGKIKGQGRYNYNANASLNVQQPSTLRYKNSGKWQGQTNTGGNLSSTANSTTFNKTKTFNKNVTINKTYQVQHFNLGGNPGGKYRAVKFNQNFRIAGAQKWRGAKYQVFVNYRPVWHDQYWWTSHHNRIVFVFGAPYYWDTGYYYPAYGYDPGANYYFEGPIYTGNPDYDPAQTVANVQSALQEQGFYQGDIDGILGPETRAALAEFQSAQGLEPTGLVDQPTLETLGMV
jgi:hypothetical protein